MSSIAIISVAANYALASVSETDDNYIKPSTQFLVDEDKSFFLKELKQSYPIGLFVSFYDLYHEQSKINKAFAKNQQFSFNATASDNANNKQLVVLVIGETSRRANWQLNGYSRPTNPLLSTQANVVNFTDMLSISSMTRSSIPMLLTRKPSRLVNNYNFPEKSVISAFKEAGFATYWLSTQQKFGAHDTSTSVYAKEADNIIFLNKTNYTNKGETDGVVLPIFEQILANQSQKTLVVIHTLGSHFDYAHRYPASFDRFKPSLNELDGYSIQEKKYKQPLINSYDNSILYTDYVINDLINSMQAQAQTESFLLYSSDHGEDLFDGQCDKSGHANETAHNFEIASLAWYSPRFAANHADKVQQLQANATKPINHTSIFPTLIDAADITIPNYSLNRSVLGNLMPYPRLVLGGRDYDRSEQQGSCREVK
ncbi:phosphoethanolamine transferase [Psychrobacter sp. ANT_H3]|uniref:phosphoethanolamine transferase n=1 Tax=Psychrobacter sp. ANT_H3 TaxID=3019444 RepID=UPI0022F1624A|nr:phosphoethanolamine transferase [Psychrobacter sp. ANT_H3]MDA5133809.1 phosphoethanolamine transferase [Psychrobacter sp. ANT_H3]